MIFSVLLSIIFITIVCFFLKMWNFQIPLVLFHFATFFNFFLFFLLGPNAFWIVLYYLGFWPVISQNFEDLYFCKQFDLLIFYIAGFCYLLIYCLVFRKASISFSKKDFVFWIAFFLLGFILLASNGLNPTKGVENLYASNGINFPIHYLQVLEYFLLNVCFLLTYIFSFFFYFDSCWDSVENKKKPFFVIVIRLFVLLCLWTFFYVFFIKPIAISFLQMPLFVERNSLDLGSLSLKIYHKYLVPFSKK